MNVLVWENGLPVIRAALPEDLPLATAADLRAGMVASRFQVRAALLLAGLLDQVEAAVAQADPLTRMAWAEAVEFRRNSPTIARLAEGLGLDAKTLDDLFAAAIQIEI